MATNIEMNIKQENGQYEIVYPQTTCQNIIDLNTYQSFSNYFTKFQTLQPSVANQFGANDGLPNTVFNKLRNVALLNNNIITNISGQQQFYYPKLYLGQYQGTNNSGPSTPNILNFPSKVDIVMIYAIKDLSNNWLSPLIGSTELYARYGYTSLIAYMNLIDTSTYLKLGMLTYDGEYSINGGTMLKKNSSNTQISWYVGTDDQGYEDRQLNLSNYIYYYLGISLG